MFMSIPPHAISPIIHLTPQNVNKFYIIFYIFYISQKGAETTGTNSKHKNEAKATKTSGHDNRHKRKYSRANLRRIRLDIKA